MAVHPNIIRFLRERARLRVNAWVILALILASLLQLAVPYLLKLFIDDAIPAGDAQMLWMLGLGGVVIYGVSSICRYLGRTAALRWAEDVRLELSQQVFAHLQGLALSYHRSRQIGDLVARVRFDTRALRDFVSSTVPQVVDVVVTILGAGAILLVLEPRLTLLAFAALPIALLIGYLFKDKIRPLSRQISRGHGDIYSTVHEALRGVEEIKVYDAAGDFEARLARQGGELRDLEVELGRQQNKLLPLLHFATSLVLLGVLVVGGYMTIAGLVTVGTIVAYYYYISKSLGPVRSTSTLALRWHRAAVAVERLEALFDCDERVAEPEAAKATPKDGVTVAFEDVSFHYHNADSGESFVALDAVDLEIAPGQRVALLGPSGSGKSTTGKMVPRLFDPHSGRVTASGTALTELSLRDWRDRVGYVGQEVLLFDATIEENIRFGATGELTDEAFAKALRAARVDDVIARKRDGLATEVGESGAKLSGGQRKRVALARALLREPAILVIDQLAADLQEELCRDIFEAIRRDYDTSILYLGHRIPAGYEPDAVFWMEDGRIKRRLVPAPDDADLVETGT